MNPFLCFSSTTVISSSYVLPSLPTAGPHLRCIVNLRSRLSVAALPCTVRPWRTRRAVTPRLLRLPPSTLYFLQWILPRGYLPHSNTTNAATESHRYRKLKCGVKRRVAWRAAKALALVAAGCGRCFLLSQLPCQLMCPQRSFSLTERTPPLPLQSTTAASGGSPVVGNRCLFGCVCECVCVRLFPTGWHRPVYSRVSSTLLRWNPPASLCLHCCPQSRVFFLFC